MGEAFISVITFIRLFSHVLKKEIYLGNIMLLGLQDKKKFNHNFSGCLDKDDVTPKKNKMPSITNESYFFVIIITVKTYIKKVAEKFIDVSGS